MKQARCLLLVLLALVCLAAPTRAADGAKPTMIAIVDVQRILQESKAAKSVQAQIESHSVKFQSQISSEEKELREAEQKLTKMRSGGEAKAYAEEEQKLRQRFMSVERHVQARRKALDQAYTEAMAAVRKNIIDIVAKVCRERGMNLAIVKQQVIWNESAIDITDDVLGRLNKNVPQIPVQVKPEGDFEASP